ncbi:hypothetical protein COLO4_22040 [Corchorus olitorius]|uniref:Uncharacterized protein n=1 Tax=Corchorus olitorius TaxID=93759 RepID=A0A1R3IPE0_9ROSI|nr:hypothetical protein COLO4_22040 [Corchorus olitorius]
MAVPVRVGYEPNLGNSFDAKVRVRSSSIPSTFLFYLYD